MGKTTIARLLGTELKCAPEEFREINAADDRGIDTVRDIKERMWVYPVFGDVRVYCLDECHMITPQGQASLLKVLEETPPHAYFILCTTNPEKLLPQVRGRCASFALRSLDPEDLIDVLCRVMALESIEVSEKVVDAIVERAAGCPRQAIQDLDKVSLLEESERLTFLDAVGEDGPAGDVFKLLFNPKVTWAELAPALQAFTGDAESLRRQLLAAFTTQLLRNTKQNDRACALIALFEGHYNDCGKAGLVRSCYEAVRKK